jgi:hypothetical protein
MDDDFDPAIATPEERGQHLARRMSKTTFTERGWGLAVGGQPMMSLWEATVDAYVAGNWIAAVLSAQAVCEQTLAHLVALRESPGAKVPLPKENWERKTLGWFVDRARKEQTLSNDVLNDIQIVCDRRVVLVHFRRPLDEGTIDRRIIDSMRAGDEREGPEIREDLLARDALHAAGVAMDLCFGDLTLSAIRD